MNRSEKISSRQTLLATLKAKEDWLMNRILDYAIRQGYAAYTSTLKEAWRLFISGLTDSIGQGVRNNSRVPELTPEEDLQNDPVAAFGIVEARRHRERGVSLSMFLGLMKYYRQTYIDLVRYERQDTETQEDWELFLNRIFDRIEIGFCVEWSGSQGDNAIQELQISNRVMTNEKNRYLTIFESIPAPVILLNRSKKIENMNLAATRLLDRNTGPGAQYYRLNRDRQLESEDMSCFGDVRLSELFPWLEDHIDEFLGKKLESMVFDKNVMLKQESIFRVRFSKSLDISGKFEGVVVILEDVTTLKQALDEVKILKGFIPICGHCKKIRDDQGYWGQIEEYIEENSEAVFSHGICQECARKHYPDLNLYGENDSPG